MIRYVSKVGLKGIIMISGKKSRELRLLRNLTQKVLAINSRLTDATIRNYELGNRSLSREQLEKIAEALGCDSSALLNHNLTTITSISFRFCLIQRIVKN